MRLYRDEFVKLIKSMPIDMSFDIVEIETPQCGEKRYSLDIRSGWWGKSIDSQQIEG